MFVSQVNKQKPTIFIQNSSISFLIFASLLSLGALEELPMVVLPWLSDESKSSGPTCLSLFPSPDILAAKAEKYENSMNKIWLWAQPLRQGVCGKLTLRLPWSFRIVIDPALVALPAFAFFLLSPFSSRTFQRLVAQFVDRKSRVYDLDRPRKVSAGIVLNHIWNFLPASEVKCGQPCCEKNHWHICVGKRICK